VKLVELKLEVLVAAGRPPALALQRATTTSRKVDIIVARYESTLKSAIAATATVPIVMIAVDYDPLALGYIKRISRPGGTLPACSCNSLNACVQELVIDQAGKWVDSCRTISD
jgi:hypothetical protein